MTSLTWIRLEVKKETVKGLDNQDPEKVQPYTAVADEPDRVDTILIRLNSKISAAFEVENYRPRALNFNML